MLGLMYAIWLRKSDGQTQRLSKQIRFNDGRISAMQAVLDDTMARVKRIETTTSKWDGLAEEIVRLGLAVKALETNTGMLAAFMPNQGEQNPK
jgi:hypothetical protein